MSMNGIVNNDYQNRVMQKQGVNNTKHTEKTGSARELSEAEEMAAFKKEFYAELERIPRDRTIANVAINISEEAFQNMKNDPKYREQMLSVIRRDLTSSVAPAPDCSLLITVGATAEDYRGDSWSVGNDSEFYARSGNSFYKKASVKKDRQKELMEEYLEKKMQAKKLQKKLLNEKIAKQEQERERIAKQWEHERRMTNAAAAYEANGDVFHRENLDSSGLSQTRAEISNRISHLIIHTVSEFSDARAEVLKKVREEKGEYDYSDVVNACGLSYARFYAEIEERYQSGNEKYYKTAGGEPLTKEEELDWLNMQYEQEVKWQQACARTAAQGQVFKGNLSEIPEKEIEELEDAFYQARDAYVNLYQDNKQAGKTLVLQNLMFGSYQMYETLNQFKNF